jgi:hypothetical protein
MSRLIGTRNIPSLVVVAGLETGEDVTEDVEAVADEEITGITDMMGMIGA